MFKRLALIAALLLPLPALGAECGTMTAIQIESQVGSPHRQFKGAEARTFIDSSIKIAKANGIEVNEVPADYDEVRVYILGASAGAVAFLDGCGRFHFQMPLEWYAQALGTLTAGN